MTRPKQNSVIVVPGLGDGMTLKRVQFVVMRWESANVSVHLFDSKWSSDETYAEKAKRLSMFYDQAKAKKMKVVAYSAGGSLALSLVNKKPSQFILISSKLKRAELIGQDYQKSSPALLDSVKTAGLIINNLDRQSLSKITCLKPLYDEVISKQDMFIAGAKIKTIPFVFHAAAIVFALVLMVPRLLRLKSKS